MVKIRTKEKVPIMEAGRFGLKGKVVKIVMNRKYTFAALLNWNNKDSGAHVNAVYLVVRTVFCNLRYSMSISVPKLIDIELDFVSDGPLLVPAYPLPPSNVPSGFSLESSKLALIGPSAGSMRCLF